LEQENGPRKNFTTIVRFAPARHEYEATGQGRTHACRRETEKRSGRTLAKSLMARPDPGQRTGGPGEPPDEVESANCMSDLAFWMLLVH
jgi:hypothetical protein